MQPSADNEVVSNQNRIIIISAPSGAGKSTLSRKLLEKHSDLVFSVSTTTRPMRTGEQNGVDYYFVTETDFEDMIKNREFVEWAVVHGNHYGTTFAELERIIQMGKYCLLEVDVQGGESLMKYYPRSTSIFIVPPSPKILEERLRARKTESEDTLRLRLANAVKELEHSVKYKHIVVNDDLNRAVDELEKIIFPSNSSSYKRKLK